MGTPPTCDGTTRRRVEHTYHPPFHVASATAVANNKSKPALKQFRQSRASHRPQKTYHRHEINSLRAALTGLNALFRRSTRRRRRVSRYLLLLTLDGRFSRLLPVSRVRLQLGEHL